MSRKISVGLWVALLLGAGTVTAPAHEAYLSYEVYDELCPDTYCGHRAYPDPFIWDGYRFFEGGYKGADYYRRTSWYKQRLARPRVVKVYVPHQHYRAKRVPH